uniref:General transcription factor 3C polypeptide 2 n=1 Tax=Aegilops tauschii TaxID=37682 RepID=N1QWY6_AEGTA
MAAPPETTGAPSPPEGEHKGNAGVEVCCFEQSAEDFSRAVRAISELAAGEPEPGFPDAEAERLASSITFLSSDFVLFAGGNVWSLDWCPRLCDKPSSPYLAVAAHPPGSSYHKIGMPLIGRGIIQVWCIVAPFEEADTNQSMLAYSNSNRRGRPRKIPNENNPIESSSVPRKPIGRPRKIKLTTGDDRTEPSSLKKPKDHAEPSLKKPRGRPRKYPLSVGKAVDSTKNSGSPGSSFVDPLVTSGVIPGDLALSCAIPSVKSVESAPKKGRGRPRKIPIDKIKCPPDTEWTEDTSRALICCTKPKKKRGRPRKYPLPSSSKHVSGTDTEFERETGYTESNSNLSLVAVDAALPVPSSSLTICGKRSRGRKGRGRPKKETNPCALSSSVVSDVQSQSRETISNDPAHSVENHLPYGHSNLTSELCSISMLRCDGNVHTGPTLEDSSLPMHIAAKSNGEESSGSRRRGRPRRKTLSNTNSCLFVSGTESSKAAATITNSDNPMALTKSDGEAIASDLASIGSLRCHIGKCNVNMSAASSDATPPTHGLCNANYKEKSSVQQTTPQPNDNVASVQNCKKELIVYTRRRVRGPTKKPASNETCSLALSGDAQKTERTSTYIMPNNNLSSVENPKLLGSSISEDMANEAGLVGCKSALANHEVVEMNDSEAANKVVPVPSENSAQIIVVEDTEVVPSKESSKNDIITCAENSNFSAIPKGIHLPRVVLCLAHNGKVAWDIKWKPPLPNQSEQKSHLGFLAVLLGSGSLEVWEVPSPSMIQKIYSSSSVKGTDPRFLKLQPVFRCAKVKCGNIQSIPLTVDWSPYPHDMILAGCHDGTVALWKFSTDLPSQDSKPFMCVTAESVPIRALSWAPYVSEENTNIFVTAGEDGLKFWDLRDPYRPLWELTTAPRAVLSLHWLKEARGIVISLEDGTLKFLSLPRIANDVPVTGRPFAGTKTQGVSTYQLSEYLIWNVHVSEITGYAAYCVADGTAVRFQLTSRFWEKEPGRNRVPYFLCGSLAEEGTAIKIGGTLQSPPMSNVPLVAKKGPKPCQKVPKAHDTQKEQVLTLTNSEHVDAEPREGRQDGPDKGQETNALALADPLMLENGGTCNVPVDEDTEDFELFPPKAVALHRLRWNMNKGSEKWLCYGGAAGIIRCQRI